MFKEGAAITSTTVKDFNGDGVADTVHILNSGQTLVLLGYTGWSNADFLFG